MRAAWQPVFDEFGVDLVLQGHDHTYARSKLVTGRGQRGRGKRQPQRRGTDVRSQPKEVRRNVAAGVTGVSDAGTVYVVSVSGPKMYDVGDRPLFRRSGGGVQLYQIVQVDGDYVAVRRVHRRGESVRRLHPHEERERARTPSPRTPPTT